MPLLVSLRQYLCLIIIILYVTSIRGFRLDPEALLKTGYSHGTLLAIGASVGFLAVVAAITIFHLRKTKDKPVNHPNDGNNQQIGSENPRHRALPAAPLPHYPPPPQLPSTAPQWNRAYNPSSIPVATGIYENDGGDIKTNAATNYGANQQIISSTTTSSSSPPIVPGYIIDSDLSSSISDFTESSSFPSPQLQASMPIPDSLYIILNECYTHRHPFLDDSAILVAPDVLGNPLSPHISDLLFQCP